MTRKNRKKNSGYDRIGGRCGILNQQTASHDGWAVGGDATTFSTAVVNPNLPDSAQLMNNLDFRSPGSDHAGIVNFGMADGSVRGLSIKIDPTVFALMGSMADRVPMCTPQ